jgi:lipoprotein-anchoring transpeptidase ErfK/SrfK
VSKLPQNVIAVVVILLVALGLGYSVFQSSPVQGSLARSTQPVQYQTESTPANSPDQATPMRTPQPTQTVFQLEFTPSPDTQVPTRKPSATPTQTPTVSPTPTRVLPTPPTPLPASALTLTPPTNGRFLLVDQDEQQMYVFQDGELIRSVPVSTGAPVSNAFTPAWRGEVGDFWGKAAFRNTSLWADYIWYLFPGAEGSILIHSVPYTKNGDEKVYDRLETLGVEPASSGCVRISPEDAEWLAAWNPVGVEIEITPLSAEILPPDDPL